MKPRYEVIADYPGQLHQIGDLIYGSWSFVVGDNDPNSGKFSLSDYPHLFRSLQWWESRRPEDLPEYVKDDNGVYMVKEWHLELVSKVTVFFIDGVHDGYVENDGECPLYSEFLPATIQQYIKYVKTKKNNG